MNSINKFTDKLLTYEKSKLKLFKAIQKRETLFIGAGFNSGDVYLLGEVKNY